MCPALVSVNAKATVRSKASPCATKVLPTLDSNGVLVSLLVLLPSPDPQNRVTVGTKIIADPEKCPVQKLPSCLGSLFKKKSIMPRLGTSFFRYRARTPTAKENSEKLGSITQGHSLAPPPTKKITIITPKVPTFVGHSR